MRQPMEYRSISRWASQGGGMIFLSCSAIGLSFPVRNCRSSSLTSSGAPSRDVICANSVSVRFFRKMQYSSGGPHKLHFRHLDLLWVGDPQARFSCCPKPSQSKNLAVVNYFLLHPHPSCNFFSSFTIRSRFFAVFIKVGRWSAWVIFALPGGFSRSPALR